MISPEFSPRTEGNQAEQFKRKIENILQTPLSVENIETFADDVLVQLEHVNEAVLTAYLRDVPDETRVGLELEDVAYAYFNLTNIADILSQAGEIRTTIQDLKHDLHAHLHFTDTVITPPDSTQAPIVSGGETGFAERRLVPRLLTLAYILRHDFSLHEGVMFIQGVVDRDMVRRNPYVCVDVPALYKVVYVCDEEENASYVFDTRVLKHIGIERAGLDVMTKSEFNHLLMQYPQLGTRLIQRPTWRKDMNQALRNGLSLESEGLDASVLNFSEFSLETHSLRFADFKEQVREAYDALETKPASLHDWYIEIYKDHRGWPRKPERTYRNSGWKGLPDLVGKEVREIVSFDVFVPAVQRAYEEAGKPRNIRLWYEGACDSHPEWPRLPDKVYKNDGWKPLSEIVGLRQYPSFEDFKTSVRKAFAADSGKSVLRWYREAYKDHPGWPSRPHVIYRDAGWVSWVDLVSKQRRKDSST